MGQKKFAHFETSTFYLVNFVSVRETKLNYSEEKGQVSVNFEAKGLVLESKPMNDVNKSSESESNGRDSNTMALKGIVFESKLELSVSCLLAIYAHHTLHTF